MGIEKPMKAIAARMEVASTLPGSKCQACARSVPKKDTPPPLTPRGYTLIQYFPVNIYI
jgi:hypothetical protein